MANRQLTSGMQVQLAVFVALACQVQLSAAGKYSDPEVVDSLVVPLVVTAVIVFILLVILVTLQRRRLQSCLCGPGCTCSPCDCQETIQVTADYDAYLDSGKKRPPSGARTIDNCCQRSCSTSSQSASETDLLPNIQPVSRGFSQNKEGKCGICLCQEQRNEAAQSAPT